MSGRTFSHLAGRLIPLVVMRKGTTLSGEIGDIGLEFHFSAFTSNPSRGRERQFIPTIRQAKA
jgi:hypothetical protein